MVYIRKFILFAAIIIIAASCSSADALIDNSDDGKSDNKNTHTVQLTASVGSNTRTGIVNNGNGTVSFYWHKGESIGVQTKDSQGNYKFTKFTTTDPTGSTTATFTGEVPDGYEVQSYAIYPYMPISIYEKVANEFTGEKSAKIWLPDQYEVGTVDSVLFPITKDESTVYSTHSTNMPMVGTITDGIVSFRHLAGMAVIRIDKMPTNCGTIDFSADQKLNGTFTISDLSAQDAQIKTEDSQDGNGYVAFSFGACEIGKQGVFFLPLSTGTYTNCVVSVSGKQRNVIPLESFTVGRGQIHSISITTNSKGQLRQIRSLGNNEYMVNGQKFLDLGLESGLLWAESNIGSSKPKKRGNYYAWGETETKESYTNENAKWGQTEYTAGTTLVAEDDVASVMYGTAVHIPTQAEFTELSELSRIYNNEYDDAERSRISFFQITSNLDNSQYLYLPLAGVMDGTSLCEQNEEAHFWTSEPSNTLTNEYRTAYYLLGMPERTTSWSRGTFQLNPTPLYRGLNIRAVTYK